MDSQIKMDLQINMDSQKLIDLLLLKNVNFMFTSISYFDDNDFENEKINLKLKYQIYLELQKLKKDRLFFVNTPEYITEYQILAIALGLKKEFPNIILTTIKVESKIFKILNSNNDILEFKNAYLPIISINLCRELIIDHILKSPSSKFLLDNTNNNNTNFLIKLCECPIFQKEFMTRLLPIPICDLQRSDLLFYKKCEIHKTRLFLNSNFSTYLKWLTNEIVGNQNYFDINDENLLLQKYCCYVPKNHKLVFVVTVD